jgi:N-6 DNA Methylase/Type III restriction enzyme, res subunit
MQQDTPVGTATASAVPVLARLKLTAELAGLIKEQGALPAGPLSALKKARIASQILVVLGKLGVDLGAKKREESAFTLEGGPEPVEQPRKTTAHLYDFDPDRKSSQRRKDNGAALELLKAIDRGEVDGQALTDAQKAALARYSGTGGNLVGADGLLGSDYEYYTPKPIAEAMWGLLGELGFKGGKTLDPCAGVGIFGATAPASVAMETVELDSTSGRINQLVNGGPGYSAIISPFEAVASQTADEQFDAVVSNIPFSSKKTARGDNYKLDPKYQNETIEAYFILRSLEKLKPGGLAAFIVPPRMVSAKGGRDEKLRIAMSYMAEFMGAYRLPNAVFGTASADTITDVIVLRKYGREAAEKIAELKQQNPAMLAEVNVQWMEFISGNYFAGEGRRFVLGEFIAKDPNKVRDVDRVVHTGSVADIAKLLRKFPGSRVDWAKLNATETEPILYNEGDTITMSGQTLQMQGGKWVALAKTSEDARIDDLGDILSTPVRAVGAKATWDQAVQYVAHRRQLSMDLDIPEWLRLAHTDVQKAAESDRPSLWNALTTGMAVAEVTRHHGGEVGFNYAEGYPAVHAAMQAVAATAKRGCPMFSPASKQALQKIGLNYDRKKGFDPFWLGQVSADVMQGKELTKEAKVEGLKYRAQGLSVDVEDLKGIYGADFDPLESDDWCVSADGKKATKPDDYYIGNMGEFLARMDAEIAQADGPLKDKLLRQKAMARERVDVVDPKALRYNLFSPFVTIEEKAAFLRQFMHPAFDIGYDSEGEKKIVLDITTDSEKDRQLKRFAEYLQRGTISTRTKSSEALADPKLEEQRRAMIREMVMRANAQFDQWTKANAEIMGRIESVANDPAKVYFRETEDGAPFVIDGMNTIHPGTGQAFTLHAYQFAEVKRRSRHFGGITGLDVGLGKTFTALACAQHIQNIGVKKKTVFVVPNAVLSNWRREASVAYASMEDCLFVGLDIDEKTGKAKVSASNYPRDFHKVLQNKHRKIFCTTEAFKTIPLKDETIYRYEDYLASVDPSFSGSDRKSETIKAENALSKVTDTGAKSGALPFFEDMGIDSIVIDECHQFKNSKRTVEFTGAKFLSSPEESDRGLDMQIKAWFVRGLSPQKDGVLGLTATPITNSPLEVYSMLSLTAGEDRVHNMAMGARGADQFMDLMCSISDEDEQTIDGLTKSYRVFSGLQNVKVLRAAMASVATIKTGEDVKGQGVDLKLPEAPETQTLVQLPKETMSVLRQYQLAFRAAIMRENNQEALPSEQELYDAAYDAVAAKFGEPQGLMANAFNLIGKMTSLIMDPELDERATFYTIAQDDIAKAEEVIAKFNAKTRKEERDRPGPWTAQDMVSAPKIKKQNGQEIMVFDITVKAALTEDDRIVIDTMDFKTQADFEAIAEKAGLDLDVSVPPKLAALLDNVQREESTPRSKSGRVKQIIFCDILSLHNKIKRLLTKRAGIPASAIAFISGPAIKNPEQMQGVQDGFNAEGEDNKYRLVIANKKAEVGINLQKGTQAIHHLTIGWTPDSQHQRNGRGVRQGNDTSVVNVYHYDADGTFDEYKRLLTNRKADWISSVMDGQGGNDVAIAGGLTKEEERELALAEGTAQIAMIQQRAQERDRAARTKNARDRQTINFNTYKSQAEFIKTYDTSVKWAARAVMAAYDAKETLQKLEASLEPSANGKQKKAETVLKIQSAIANLKVNLEGMVKRIDESVTFTGRYKTTADILNATSYSTRASDKRERAENYAKYNVTVNAGSDIEREWQAEILRAERIQEEALKDFEAIGNGGDSGYPARFAQAIKDGQAVVLDGKIYAKGMFVRALDNIGGNYLLVVRDKEWCSSPKPGIPDKRIADVATKGWEVIIPGTSSYEGALNEAAQIDDSLADGASTTQAAEFFTAYVPEVAQRRTKKTTLSVQPGRLRLDAPLFPHAIRPKEGCSAALKAIAAKQAGVILEWRDNFVTAVVASDGAYTLSERGSGVGDDVFAQDLAEVARAYGTPLTIADYQLARGEFRIQESGGGLVAMLLVRFPLADHSSEIDSATSEDEVKAVVKQAVDAALSPVLIIPEAFDYMGALSWGNVPMHQQATFRIRTIAKEAQAAKAAEEARLAAERGEVTPTATEAPGMAAASSIRMAPWPEGNVTRVYFNGLPGLQKREGFYAQESATASRGWTFAASRDMTYTRQEQYAKIVEAELLIMNGGQPIESFQRIKELAGVSAPPAVIVSVQTDPGQLTGTVAIRGKTQANKDLIKRSAGVVGGTYRFVKNGGDAYWTIPAAGWAWIKKDHPEVAEQLTATQA